MFYSTKKNNEENLINKFDITEYEEIIKKHIQRNFFKLIKNDR